MSGSLILNCIQTCVALGGKPNMGRKPAVAAPKEWTVGLVRENNIGLTGLDVAIHVVEWVSEIMAKTLIDHCTPNGLYFAPNATEVHVDTKIFTNKSWIEQ